MSNERVAAVILTATIASLFSNRALSQELPPWASWADQRPSHESVLETFQALKDEAEPDMFVASKDRSSVSFSDWNGKLKGYWQFSGGDVDMAPTRYFRYTILPGNTWHIEVSWACDDAPAVCQEFHRQIPNMLPPAPPPPPPG